MLDKLRLRLWLAWCALRGRQVGMYDRLCRGKSVAYRISVIDGGMHAQTDESWFQECVVSGSRGYGYSVSAKESA